MSYHRIRSGLWETAPPKHTRALSARPPARTHTHADTDAAGAQSVTRGDPRGDGGRQLGTRQPQTNARSWPLGFLERRSFRAPQRVRAAQSPGAPTCSRAQLMGGGWGVGEANKADKQGRVRQVQNRGEHFARENKTRTKESQGFPGVVGGGSLIMSNGWTGGNGRANESDLDGVVRCEASGLCPA